MARKKQEGNRFFRMDADFFSDRKIKILKARYGADGIVLYLYLLCEIYKTGYYLQVDDDFEYIISDDLNMDGNVPKPRIELLPFLKPLPEADGRQQDSKRRGQTEMVETCRDCQICQSLKRGHQNNDTLQEALKIADKC